MAAKHDIAETGAIVQNYRAITLHNTGSACTLCKYLPHDVPFQQDGTFSINIFSTLS